mmetsp:Transcript_28655/g.27656  ORF Transcript_28655/g.27656 Transcript_28655/m.27656 type:complete len:101 (+) Transcript_28655:717-1019(+)
MTLIINENNYNKVNGCSECHYFNYFKTRAFFDHVMYLEETFRLFLFTVLWPNKCEDHYETAAARTEKTQLMCMKCFKIMPMKQNHDSLENSITKKTLNKQ